MDPFHVALARRVAQFEYYLRQMEQRRTEVGSDCFIVFHEDDQNAKDAFQLPACVRKYLRKKARRKGIKPGTIDHLRSPRLPIRVQSKSTNFKLFEPPKPEPPKFVQFAYWEKFFVMDLPCDILSPEDARRIQRDRTGFFFVGERDNYPHYRQDVPEHNPFQKQFVYGDRETAANDIAHILFHVWHFPVDSRLYVSSASFRTSQHWEKSLPLD